MGSSGARWCVAVVALVAVAVTAAVAALPRSRRRGARRRTCSACRNTLVGNGWREEMICAVKAQALGQRQGQQGHRRQPQRRCRRADRGHPQPDLGGRERDHHQPVRARRRSTAVIKQAAARGIKVVVGRPARRRAPQALQRHQRPGRLRPARRRVAVQAARRQGQRRRDARHRRRPGRHRPPQGLHAGARRSTRASRSSRRRSPDWTFAHGRQADPRHPELGHAGRRRLDVGHRLHGRQRVQDGRQAVRAGRGRRQQRVPQAAPDPRASRAPRSPTRPTIGGVGAAVALELLQGKNVPKWVKLTPAGLGQRQPGGKDEIKANYSPKPRADVQRDGCRSSRGRRTRQAAARRLQGPVGRRGIEHAGGGARRLRSRSSVDELARPMTPLLEARDVAKRYGPVVALAPPSSSVEPGEVHALLGANGAGKSTLVKMLTGVIRADAGTIAVAASRCASARPRGRARVGLAPVFQDPALVPDLTVAQNLRLTRHDDRAPCASGCDAMELDVDFAELRRRRAAADAAHARPRARARARPAAAAARRDHRGAAVRPRRAGLHRDARAGASAAARCSSSPTASPR